MSLVADSRLRKHGRGAGGPPPLRQQSRAIAMVLVVGAVLMTLLGVVAPAGGMRFALIVLVSYVALMVVTRVLAPFGHLPRASRRTKRRASPAEAKPGFVEEATRHLDLASSSAGRFEQLRGLLVEIAEQRLAVRGIRLASDGAREALGDEAWQLLTRPLERDKFAPGPTPAELNRLLAALEGL